MRCISVAPRHILAETGTAVRRSLSRAFEVHPTTTRSHPGGQQLAPLYVALVAALLSSLPVAAAAQDQPPAPPAPQGGRAVPSDSGKKLSPEQLQSLVAPIALYPDDLLAQTLVACTYPLEAIQLHQWLAKHPGLKDQALRDSVGKQPWDPAIQSMAPLPEVVKRLADDIQWTTDLGNAFLAQQADVMNAVQVMRKKAKDNGALESNEQQKVETKVIEKKEVIIVESANPEVVYVPSYAPAYVYGPAPYYYPYPPIYYPAYYPGMAFMSFGIGMAWGAAMWGGACCHAGWGGNNIIINNNNNFNRVDHRNGDRGNGGNRGNNVGNGGRNQVNPNDRAGNRGNAGNRGGGGNTWQHNPQHRGGAPYADQRTADKFGGSTRGQGGSDRAASARQSLSASNRAAGVGSRGSGAGPLNQPGGVGNRDAGSRGGSANRGSSGLGGSQNGFSGGSRGYDGSRARASSSRGASSMGGRGGGSRGGGGGRRR